MRSIRSRLTRRVLLVLGLLLGAGWVATYAMLRITLTENFDTVLRTRALAVSALTEIEDGRLDTDFSPDFLLNYGAAHPGNYFEIWDSAGKVLIRSPSLQGADLPIRPGRTPGHPAHWDTRLANGQLARAVAFDYVPGPGDNPPPHPPPRPTVRLTVAVDRHDLDRTLHGIRDFLLGCGLLIFAVVQFLIPRVLRQGLAPLNELAEETARIDAGSLSHRFPSEGLPAELQPIAARLNGLLARLESSFDRERRFSADLAHELRTPIAELRTLAECAVKWPETRDAASDQDLLDIAARLEGLVARMLQLIRSEHGQLTPVSAPVEVSALAARTWRPFAERAAARGLQVRFELAPATVEADGSLLRSILGNLFENAVAYAPAGAEVRVAGRADGGGYRLEVSNPAAGLSAEDLPHIFDRFWRKEASRTGQEHFGLGLSLARNFARAMGWELTAAVDARNWIVFTLSAPKLRGGNDRVILPPA